MPNVEQLIQARENLAQTPKKRFLANGDDATDGRETR